MSGGGGGDGPGCPLWIISFADMISNLVIFFILMATFGSHDAGKPPPAKMRDEGAFAHDGAALPNVVPVKPKEGARRGTSGSESPSARRDREMLARFDRFVQSADYDVKPALERLPDGLRLRVQADELFKPGSAQLSDDAGEIVAEVGRFFRAEPVEFAVEAHVDDRTFRFTNFSDDVDYSRRLAVRAARILADAAGVERSRIAVSARGAAEPTAGNDTASGRARNRRIEVVVRMRP